MPDILKGYKQTEIGVIPEDWETKPLAAVGNWKGGATPSMRNPRYWYNGTIPWVSSGEVKSVLISDTAVRITDAAVNETSTALLPPDSVIVVTRSGILRKFLPVAKNTRCLAINQDIKGLIPSCDVLADYLLHLLICNGPRILATCLKSGTTVESIELPWLKAFQVPLPPAKAEQEAIATALGDADALIESLEKLIAKKRQIKQGAMQELLTGKRRLPGFSGAWETKRLGELFNFSGGFTASRDQLSSDGYCYLHYGDIHTSTRTFIDVSAGYSVIPKLQVPISKVSPMSLLCDGDVVFVDASEDDDGTSKHVVVVNPEGRPFISGLHTIVAKAKTDELDHGYLRHCFQTAAIKRQFLFYAVGTKVSGISKANIAKITMPVPTVTEQTAIAEILSDMDAEIEALEARLAKARLVKQGMMQDLLTGRIRLV